MQKVEMGPRIGSTEIQFSSSIFEILKYLQYCNSAHTIVLGYFNDFNDSTFSDPQSIKLGLCCDLACVVADDMLAAAWF